MISDNGDVKNYTSFKVRYDVLVRALQESEARLNFLLRSNDRIEYIREERDNYQSLITQLQALRTEYDTWLRTVQ
jgi:hypothetical protein